MPLPARRRRVFLVVTLLLPVVALAALEGVLRLVYPDPTRPTFVPAPFGDRYRIANPRLGARYFVGERNPPSPQPEPFATTKPARAFRVFVLGESTAAGFPYPRNGTFSRLLRDALRDVLPSDSVEVVNLGVAATNSYTMLDLADDVVDAQPDAVLIYAGHNEYYGALGVGSTQGGMATPALVRATLTLSRFRTLAALRDGILALRRSTAGSATADSAATFMESLARDQRIVLGSDEYRRGLRQFDENLGRVVRRFRDAGLPVLVAGIESNMRDQAPFASPGNGGSTGADAVYRAARAALVSGDTAAARASFVRARDLDVVRFRAPTAFNAIIRRIATTTGAIYVPVPERFAESSPGGIPGSELFLEHVHPNRNGYAVIARGFFDALRDARFFGHTARLDRLRSWDAYVAGTELTPFDERIAHHTVMTVVTRWPFVPVDDQRDYRGTYRASGFADSLALLVSRGGMTWQAAKLAVASDYERRSRPDSAVAEYRGLARDIPLAEFPLRLEARALLAANRPEEAERVLEQAMRVEPTGAAAFTLGMIAIRRGDVARGIPHLEQATQLDPRNAAALYQLSLAYGLTHDLDRARTTAERLFRTAPQFPGLAGWMAALGMRT